VLALRGPRGFLPAVTTDPRVSLFRSVPTDLGEGAVWHPAHQSLFWVDIMGRKIHETAVDSGATLTRPVAALVGALAPTRRGDLLVALQDGIHRLDLDSLSTSPFACPPEHDPRTVRFNDAKCDPQGRLWAAHWDGWCVSRWDPVRARLLETLRLPVARVTTCTFGGPLLDTLFLTTASHGLTPAERQAQPEAGFVFAADTGTRGRITDFFSG